MEKEMSEVRKCPVCDGQGIVSKPPYIAGDVHEWTDSQTSHECHACGGKGYLILWRKN